MTDGDVLGWIGAIAGIAGTLLLAIRIEISGWGWVLYLVSNCCWMAYSMMTSSLHVLAMQSVNTIISSVGVYVWLVRKPTTTCRISSGNGRWPS